MDIWVDSLADCLCTPKQRLTLSKTPLFIIAAILDAEKDSLTLTKGDIAKAIWDVWHLESHHLQRFKVHLYRAKKALESIGYTFRLEVPGHCQKRPGAADVTRIWIVPLESGDTAVTRSGEL